MASPTVTISTPVSPALAEDIERIAKLTHRNRAAWLRDTLVRLVAEHKRTHPPEADEELTLADVL